MPAVDELIGTAEVSLLIGKARRSVEWLVAEGRLRPAAVVSERNVWSRRWVEAQDWTPLARGEAMPAPPPLALVGIDDFADALGLSVAAVRYRIDKGQVPPATARVSGALCWTEDVFGEWLADCDGVTA